MKLFKDMEEVEVGFIRSVEVDEDDPTKGLQVTIYTESDWFMELPQADIEILYSTLGDLICKTFAKLLSE